VTKTALDTAYTLGIQLLPTLTEMCAHTSDELAQDLSALANAIERLGTSVKTEGTSRHDLLNSVAAVKGYAEMLLDSDDEALSPIRDLVSQVVESLTEMTQSPDNTASANRTLDSFEGCTVLIVDDLAENLELMSRLLGKMKCDVHTAISGNEALEILAEVPVDVVLLDLVMPGIDGREVLATIKADEQLRATPVIMISGRQDMDQIIDCIQVGADDYLLKPVNSVLLSARIKSGLERKRWHDKEENYRIQLEKRERFIRQTFGRYISDSIVEEILEKPEGLKLGGDLRNVTLMMSDIRSFTTLVEHLPPEQVVTILNRYLGRMTDIILKNGGTIDEFLGDAVLAAFGAPSVSEQHAMQAVTCAIEMQAAMASINSENRADGLPELEMAIALNTGEVVAGNIGSERRSKYGFVGHEVNVTSRIEDHAAPNEILVSEKTLQSIEAHHFSVGDSRIVKAKGMEGMLTVYPIKGVADNE
jgi:adenylate cyclase